jgi:CheY-like chemotaxis protein
MTAHPAGTILLIDNEPSFVRALAQLLHRDGYRVDTATEGQQALTQLQSQRYDVILCDLWMPGLDGRAFYTRLQQQVPALCARVIFITGDTLEAESTAFLAQCGRPALTKPCPAAAIRQAIKQVLDTEAAIRHCGALAWPHKAQGDQSGAAGERGAVADGPLPYPESRLTRRQHVAT